MADLDDFFAKKDRKKSKSVKKFSTTDEVTKKLDDPKQKSDVRPKKDRPAQEGEEGGRAREEEEWKEYEETVKDYTGLKIQVLQGGNGQPESGRDQASEDAAAADGGKVKGPWNKPKDAPEPVAPPPVEEREKKEPPKASSAYVPPVARNRPTEPVVRRNQNKHAPDITNSDFFPVLGAGPAARRTAPGGGGAGGAVGAGGVTAGGAPLTLGNRYNSLREDS